MLAGGDKAASTRCHTPARSAPTCCRVPYALFRRCLQPVGDCAEGERWESRTAGTHSLVLLQPEVKIHQPAPPDVLLRAGSQPYRLPRARPHVFGTRVWARRAPGGWILAGSVALPRSSSGGERTVKQARSSLRWSPCGNRMPALHSASLPRSDLRRNRGSCSLLQGLSSERAIKTRVGKAFFHYSHSLETGNCVAVPGPLACPGMAKIFLSAWPGQHPASPAGNAVKPIFASGWSEGGRDGSSETHCGALPSAAAEEESQTQVRPSLQTPAARQPRKVLSPDQGGSTEAKASQVIGWQPANAHLRTDLPATRSAMHLRRSSLQKSGACPFLSHVSILCRLPGAPGTFRCPRSAQHHRYGYCPAPVFPQDFWPSVPRCVGHLPAPLWVSPSALQRSQPITSSLALGETQPRTLLAAHTSGRSWWPQPMPTPANEDIPTGSRSWSGVIITLVGHLHQAMFQLNLKRIFAEMTCV